MNKNWSFSEIQDIVFDKEPWDKKHMYATDSDKCPRGLYYSLTGEEPTSPFSAKSKRRMEVGNMIEANQLKKLRSLGIIIGTQDRIFDAEYDVSGRYDALIINPNDCSERAKGLIGRKKEIFLALEKLDEEYWDAVNKFEKSEITILERNTIHLDLVPRRNALYDEDRGINTGLLIPNPENALMIVEFKSIVEKGFEWRKKDGKPMDSHLKQLMFYLWKKRMEYPNIIARLVYVDTGYQNLLEFDIEVEDAVISDLQRLWRSIKDAVANKVLPPAAPDVVINPMTGKWQLNYQADWCNYHIKCTGDPDWKNKAYAKLEELNGPTTRKKNNRN